MIRLDMGNPDLTPPQPVIDALCRSVQRLDHHGYLGYRGIAALQEACAFITSHTPFHQRSVLATHFIITLIGSSILDCSYAHDCLSHFPVTRTSDHPMDDQSLHTGPLTRRSP